MIAKERGKYADGKSCGLRSTKQSLSARSKAERELRLLGRPLRSGTPPTRRHPAVPPSLTNWLLRHTCFCLRLGPPTSRALLSTGSASRFSELRVASGFAVRAITGASIGSRDWERIPNLVHVLLSLSLFLSLPLSSTILFPSLHFCSFSFLPSVRPSRRSATGLNLWDNKECGA